MGDDQPAQAAPDAPPELPRATTPPSRRSRLRRWLRGIAWTFGGLLALIVVAAGVLRIIYNDARLAKLIAKQINKDIRGRVVIKSLHVRLWDVLRHLGDVPLRLRDVYVYDPYGTEVMHADEITSRLDLWKLVNPRGHQDLTLHKLDVEHGFVDVVLVPAHDPITGVRLPYPHDDEYGFLAAFESRKPPDPNAPGRPGPIFNLESIRLSHINLRLLFEYPTDDKAGPNFHKYGWEAYLEDLSTDDGTLVDDFRIPKKRGETPDFSYALKPYAKKAKLTIKQLLPLKQDLVVDFTDVTLAEFGAPKGDEASLHFDLHATTLEGADAHAYGKLTDLYNEKIGGGVDMAIDVTKAGPLLSRLALAYPDVHVSGANTNASIKIHGPFIDTILEPTLTNLDVTLAGPNIPRDQVPPFTIAKLTANVDLAAQLATITELRVLGQGGALTVAGSVEYPSIDYITPDDATPWQPCSIDKVWFGHERPCWAGTVTIDRKEPLDLERWIPADVVKITAGTKLYGKLDVRGTADDLLARDIALTLGTATAGGSLAWKGGILRTDQEPFDVTAPVLAASASANGVVDTNKKQLKLAFAAAANRLTPILRRYRLPALATSATATGTVVGGYDQPTIDASVVAQGVPVVGQVNADLVDVGPTLTIRRVYTRPFGGVIEGGGVLHLGGYHPTLTGGHLSAVELDLAKIPNTKDTLSGKAHFELVADGPLARPHATLDGGIDDVTASGEPLGTATMHVTTDAKGIDIASIQLGRPQGGSLDLHGHVGYDTSLDLDVDMKRLPLATLPVVAKNPDLKLEGEASLGIHVGGDVDAPVVDGDLDLARVALGDTLFGAAHIVLSAVDGKAGAGKVAFAGKLFQGKFQLEGVAGILPPFGVTVRVKFRQVELDEFTPLLADTIGARGWATGYVDLTVGMVGPKLKIGASARIAELHLEVDGEDEHGRPHPVQIDNVNEGGQHPIAIEWDGTTARLLEPVQLRGPNGVLTLDGSYAPTTVDVSLNGQVELGLAEFFTRRLIDGARGTALVDLRVTGDPKQPQVRGTVAIKDASFMPRNSETLVAVPSGTFRIDNQQISAQAVDVEVDGQTVELTGSMGLDHWHPTTVTANLTGRLAARLLEVFANQQITGASGSAKIALDVTGRAMNPAIAGSLTFDAPFELAPRGLRRQIIMKKGTIAFQNQTLAFKGVSGLVDEAPLSITDDSYVALYAWAFKDINLHVLAEGLTHRIPGTLEVEANSDLRLYGDAQQLHLAGAVNIVDGVYNQQFRVSDVFIPVRATERSTPFWEGSPLLENLAMDLTVRTTGTFKIATNIVADTYVSGSITITGTPPDPKLDGRITLDEGTIKIPGIKPTFQLKSGNVNFSPFASSISSGASVDIQADTIYTDLSERNHTVFLRVYGPLDYLNFDLRTDTGLNKFQTLTLIVSGRTADQLRQEARGDDPGAIHEGSAGTGLNTGASSGVAGATDRVVKDFASDFISVLVEAPIKDFTGLDCFRLEVGTESAQVYGCKKFGRIVKLELEYETGFRGGQRVRGGLTFRLSDNISVVGDVQRRTFDDPTLPSDIRAAGTAKFRFTIP